MTLFRALRVHQIFGAGTDVGKTIFSTLLCRASLQAGEKVHYLKPIGTAEPGVKGDEQFVAQHASTVGNALLDAACLFRFEEPVSPHLAANNALRRGGCCAKIPSDDEVTEAIYRHVGQRFPATASTPASMYIESAGGVLSPVLSGTLQADAYRSLRLPTILVASAALGGISSTLSAYESLRARGYDVDAVLCFREDYYRNHEYFKDFFADRNILCATADPPPARTREIEDDQALSSYFEATLDEKGDETMNSIRQELDRKHHDRLQNLDSMAARSMKSFWWPFVQHSHIQTPDQVLVIDSADGDIFRTYSTEKNCLLTPVFDGSASWWSQGFGHANGELRAAATYAAGRYGHVMFPLASHEPALELAEHLIRLAGNNWAHRCFFSDDGSTATEVALKMALRLHLVRSGNRKRRPLGVLGIKGSYHGDTIGAMDASPANTYNERVDWYSGRGFWLDPVVVTLQHGRPILHFDADQWQGFAAETDMESLAQIYDVETRLRTDPLTEVYQQHIRARLKNAPVELAALILEPIILGAAGMVFVDPLFQRILVDIARYDLNLPVIYDEVFVGMGRLGYFSAGTALLGAEPDIAAFGKILTGGLVPLSATLASDEVFCAFKSEHKVDALLHGHSYTAHPIGCSVALVALDMMGRLGVGVNFNGGWSQDFAINLSSHPRLEGSMVCFRMGVRLMFETDNPTGYNSTAASELQNRLRHQEGKLSIHIRPLGNVLYLICNLNSTNKSLEAVESALKAALEGLM